MQIELKVNIGMSPEVLQILKDLNGQLASITAMQKELNVIEASKALGQLNKLAAAPQPLEPQPEEAPEEKTHIDVAQMKKSPGRPKKQSAPVVAPPTVEIEEDFLEEEEDKPEAPSVPTHQEVMLRAQAYAKKHGTAEAKKVLSNFKVVSVRALKDADLPKAFEAFTV